MNNSAKENWNKVLLPFVWERDAKIGMCGQYARILLLQPRVVRLVAFVSNIPHGGGYSVIRRTMCPVGGVDYIVKNSNYPFPDKFRIEIIHKYGKSFQDCPQPSSIEVIPEVAEEMIRVGELIMRYPSSEQQQDIYWKDDRWYQENMAGKFVPQMP